MMRKRERGFSVPEILTASSLLLIFLGGLYLVLLAGQRHSFRIRNLHEAQSEARVGIRKLTEELRNTSLHSVQASDFPTPYCIFASTAASGSTNGWSSDGSGTVQWRKWVCFSQDTSSGELRRSELGFASPAATSPTVGSVRYPTFSELQAQPQTRVVARHITQLNIQRQPGGDGVRVVLGAELHSGTTRATKIKLRSLVYPRNA